MADPRQQAVDRVRLANVVKRRSFLDRLGFAAAGIREAWRLVQPVRHCPFFGQKREAAESGVCKFDRYLGSPALSVQLTPRRIKGKTLKCLALPTSRTAPIA